MKNKSRNGAPQFRGISCIGRHLQAKKPVRSSTPEQDVRHPRPRCPTSLAKMAYIPGEDGAHPETVSSSIYLFRDLQHVTVTQE